MARWRLLGWRLLFEPSARVVHRGGASGGDALFGQLHHGLAQHVARHQGAFAGAVAPGRPALRRRHALRRLAPDARRPRASPPGPIPCGARSARAAHEASPLRDLPAASPSHARRLLDPKLPPPGAPSRTTSGSGPSFSFRRTCARFATISLPAWRPSDFPRRRARSGAPRRSRRPRPGGPIRPFSTGRVRWLRGCGRWRLAGEALLDRGALVPRGAARSRRIRSALDRLPQPGLGALAADGGERVVPPFPGVRAIPGPARLEDRGGARLARRGHVLRLRTGVVSPRGARAGRAAGGRPERRRPRAIPVSKRAAGRRDRVLRGGPRVAPARRGNGVVPTRGLASHRAVASIRPRRSPRPRTPRLPRTTKSGSRFSARAATRARTGLARPSRWSRCERPPERG